MEYATLTCPVCACLLMLTPMSVLMYDYLCVLNLVCLQYMCHAPGGGWTVFQRRRDGSVSFNRGWLDYRGGFGEPQGEYWLGNQQLHLLTNHVQYSLRIDMQDWSQDNRHALYRTFW